MVATWLWGSASIFFLAWGTVHAWGRISLNNTKTSLPTYIALLVLTAGLGLQCSYHISLIAKVGILLITMAYFLTFMTQVINLKLKTPLLTLLANPLAILLLAVGFRLMEGISTEQLLHKALNQTLALHIFLVLFSFTIIFLSVLVSAVLLIQDLKLKRKLKFKITLPSLDFLERIVRTLNNISLLVLTGAIGAGRLYARNVSPEEWQGGTFYWTIATWSVLFVLNILHFTNRISGQRFAWGNFVVALVALIAIMGQSH